MKRQAPNMASRVYAYGCLAPTEGWEHALAEVARQRALWDALVRIDREHDRQTHEAARGDDPQIEACAAELFALSGRIGELIDARRALRAKARKKIDTPELDAQIEALVRERKQQRRALWELLAAWRKAHKDTVDELEQWRRDQVRLARQGSECYWPNYNRTIAAYDAGRKTARRMGRRLRYSDPARDDGVLTCQIQRTRSGLGASFGELFGELSMIRIDPIDPRAHDPATRYGERRRLWRTRVTMRVDAAGNTITLPLILHRPVPEGARIKSVALTWRREGERLRYQLCLTISMPRETPAHPSPRSCGIDLGWRREPDESLLVATCVGSDGTERRYRLPARWMSAMDQVERLHQHIDDETLRLAEQIAELELDRALPEPIIAAFKRWRPGLGARHVDCAALHDAVRCYRMGVAKPAMRLDSIDAVPAPVRHWYDRYRHLLVWRDRLRAKLLRRRREIYRGWAREIAQHHALIGVDVLDLAVLARTKKRDDGTDPTLGAGARAQRQRACVHALREILRDQAAKAGAQLHEIDGPTTLTCHYCGARNQPRDRAQRVWKCTGCDKFWDRDLNAARNIRVAAEQRASAPVAPAAPTKKNKGLRGPDGEEKDSARRPRP